MSRTLPVRRFARGFMPALLAALVILPAAPPAEAEPVYKDRERFDAPAYRPGRPYAPPRDVHAEPGRPARIVTFGPGYAGSDWGLGKPSFWGIGPRPDDGW